MDEQNHGGRLGGVSTGKVRHELEAVARGDADVLHVGELARARARVRVRARVRGRARVGVRVRVRGVRKLAEATL